MLSCALSCWGLIEFHCVCPRMCAIRLCRRVRVNPAALPSGFVFCYPCAHRFVDAHARCPVTRLPCGVGSLRRIFEPDGGGDDAA